jgi:predicted kinase
LLERRDGDVDRVARVTVDVSHQDLIWQSGSASMLVNDNNDGWRWRSRKSSASSIAWRIAVSAELHITVGIPGCGKSTWADMNFGLVVSSDRIRQLLTGSEDNQDRNREVFDALHDQVRAALTTDHRVCVDATNLEPSHRADLLRIAEEVEAAAYAHRFRVSSDYDECQRRNVARSRIVREEVMRGFHALFLQNCSSAQLQAERWIVCEV